MYQKLKAAYLHYDHHTMNGNDNAQHNTWPQSLKILLPIKIKFCFINNVNGIYESCNSNLKNNDAIQTKTNWLCRHNEVAK